MDYEIIRQQCINDPDLLVITGSRLYGTARFDEKGTCISDEDLRGVVVPPLAFLTGVREFDEGTGSLSDDHKTYSLRKFLSMVLKGNFQCIEMLFVPDSHIKKISSLGEELLSLRDSFVSKVAYRSISGFSYSEWMKAKGRKNVPLKRTAKQKQVLNDIRNAFTIPKDRMDEAISILHEGHEFEEVDSKNEVGEKRRAEYDKFGYCASCAHHAIRLLNQCKELMETGFITFPRPEASLLSSVKRGEPAFGEVEKMYEQALEGATLAYHKSELQDRADTNKAWEWYDNLMCDHLDRQLQMRPGLREFTTVGGYKIVPPPKSAKLRELLEGPDIGG